MFERRRRYALLVGTALGTLVAGPAWAQGQDCVGKLDQIEQRIGGAELPEERRSIITSSVETARAASEAGDEEGCNRVVAELDGLIGAMESSGELQASSTTGDQPRQDGDSGSQEQAATDEPAQPEDAASVTARVQIDQPEPQVLVSQKPPKVTVHIGKPVVTIRMPKPEIEVQMPDPEVQVEQMEPEIRVVMAEPELQVQDTQSESQQGQAEQQVDANVQYEGEAGQPEIEVTTEEPEIRVEQQEPEINVTEGPQDGAGSESQQMATAGREPVEGRQGGDGQQQAALGNESQEEQGSEQQRQAGERAMESESAAPALQDTDQRMQQEAAAGGDAMHQQDEQDAGQQQAATDAGAFQAMSASDLLGTEVVNEEGDTVAEIVDLVKDGETTYVVLSVGGFLGIGDKEVAMPIDRFEVGGDERVLLPGETEEELESMPSYDEAAYEKVTRVN
jgi:hypothetical protein